MQVNPYEACVYTIALPQKLYEASTSRDPLPESKRWATALRLFQQAKKLGQDLLVTFADSRDCRKLIAWSIVRDIKVNASGTNYKIGELWSLKRKSPQELRLLDTGEFIAPNHIRPYVLCYTPEFLFQQANRPIPWQPTSEDQRLVREGTRILATHMRIERNPSLVSQVKSKRIRENDGHLCCEICDFDFLETYGQIGANFIEAHHIVSLAESPKHGRLTGIDDFVLVCSNCHSMLHRTPFPTVESLRGRVRSARKKAQRRITAS